MANYKLEEGFKQSVIPDSLLDDAIDWIKSNLSPDQVFDKSDLEAWAQENDYIKEGDCECDEE